MNKTETNHDIDIMQIIGMLMKRWYLLLISAILFAAMAFGYTKLFVSPTYEASATLLINGGSSLSTTYQDIVMGKQISSDYPHILRANLTLEAVADKLNSSDFSENEGVPYREYSAGVLSGMISSETLDDSRIFRITVRSSDPGEAALVANTAIEVFPKRVQELIKGSNVGVVDYAITPVAPTAPNVGRNTAVGFIGGLVLSMALIIVFGLNNDTIESESWVIQTFKDEIPLLTIVPDRYEKHDGKYDKYGKYSRYRSKYYYRKEK